ncbi:endonuclease III [Candidatus Peregrinibacteria bacterium CG_4_10_14_0_2_um_filter_38_24]|nr:MAG: endonuclease III [Candidatus Peregrinibacteria bacterium CG_4_10_14_0_2_um_filter_38_24]PJC38791.1 MAG: endonuclease III [Candidatus Peregrinibacteria bacterium CG_4_9_14_0_2_um_filter_38_9]
MLQFVKNNISEIIKILEKTYPDAKIELDFGDNFQLLVAVILSAQCTDVRVNKVTPALFEKLPDVRAVTGTTLDEIEKFIYSTGFYRAKAKNIKAAAEKILKNFKGKVPNKMDDLLTLPGVARKTANVVLSSGFGKDEGIVVDTHVARISGKLGLVPKKMALQKNAVKIEQELMKIVPKSKWGKFSHMIVWHGRRICFARKPNCKGCPLNKICPSSEA